MANINRRSRPEQKKTMTDQEIQKDGEAIFGSDFDLSQARAEADEYYIRAELAHIEMEKFFDSLPEWVSEEMQFALFMMPDSERADWLKANAPVKDAEAPYFQRTLVKTERAAVKVGGIIVR